MPDLPAGTVTFLFTDIEGSTALWERDQAAMATAVARHIALLDAVIQPHGGIHFKTIGDAVQAAFPTAPQAVAAAVDGQRALLARTGARSAHYGCAWRCMRGRPNRMRAATTWPLPEPALAAACDWTWRANSPDSDGPATVPRCPPRGRRVAGSGRAPVA